MLAALLELAPAGVEQVDGEGWVEYAVYGAPGELPSFPGGEAEVGGVLVGVHGEQVADDWSERWKRFHEPVLLGDRLWVRPPWAEARPGALDLVVDPGEAFGTGAHPTTRLSLELMLGLEPRGSFADLGCGSGVLAIAAALLGFGPVTAVDYEVAAVEATGRNAAANGLRVDRVERVNLRDQAPPVADTVAANLTRPLLREVARRLERPPRTLIVSGLLDEEAEEIAAAFAPLRELRRLSDGGWTALLLAAYAGAHPAGNARTPPTLEAVSVLEQVQDDVKSALKAGEKQRVHALRLIASELQKAAKENGGEEVEVLQRERKRRLEAAEAFRSGGRTDLAEGEEREAEIISGYLPEQMSDSELQGIVGDAVAESGASSPQEMGKVMALVMPKVKGRADGKRVSALVKEKLTA